MQALKNWSADVLLSLCVDFLVALLLYWKERRSLQWLRGSFFLICLLIQRIIYSGLDL